MQRRIAVPWARFAPLRTVARRRSPRTPPVLVCSLPRSGSSWVGEVLGGASDALYLREPITQTWLGPGRRTIFAVDPAAPPADYAAAADAALAGIPVFPRNIVRKPEQWEMTARAERRVVVKEVNPMALSWLRAAFAPRTILLVRHPAAVAESSRRLGWTEIDPAGQAAMFLSGPLARWRDAFAPADDFWTRHGVLQGAATRVALDATAGAGDCRVVAYESLCADPLTVFRDLFDFAGLTWTPGVEGAVAARSGAAGDRADAYGTVRDSRGMIDRWRRDVTAADAARVREGWRRFDLPWYADGADW